jgi:L-ascorbate metabolism protein UlaG (beta-lactamase superfamily)
MSFHPQLAAIRLMSSADASATVPTTVPAGLAITWVGHATVLVEIDGCRVITDPVLRHRIGHLVRIVPDAPEIGAVDAVLISHLHADHADPPSLSMLRNSGAFVVPPSGKRWLSAHGLGPGAELGPGESLSMRGVQVIATTAVHDGRRWPFGPAADAVGYLIHGSRSVYFAGDTDFFHGMAELRGRVDVALLPVWGWGPRLGPGHLNPETAAAAAALIAPSVAIPIHWGTFSIGRPARRPDDPGRPAREFAAFTRDAAPEIDVRTLSPGERIVL